MGNPEGRRPLRRPGLRRENNIKINLQEVGWEVMDWIGLLRIRTGGGHL
jgi:hypothetical protein